MHVGYMITSQPDGSGVTTPKRRQPNQTWLGLWLFFFTFVSMKTRPPRQIPVVFVATEPGILSQNILNTKQTRSTLDFPEVRESQDHLNKRPSHDQDPGCIETRPMLLWEVETKARPRPAQVPHCMTHNIMRKLQTIGTPKNESSFTSFIAERTTSVLYHRSIHLTECRGYQTIQWFPCSHGLEIRPREDRGKF